MSEEKEYKMVWWVRAIYYLAEKWDRVFTRVANMTVWRYRFYDAFCYCSNCQKRRKEGRQASAWSWGGEKHD